ncbi:MAG: 4-hydroxythreonine-4-phosphate dehydrogenase PdxA, partial [Balneolaceae bacterium]
SMGDYNGIGPEVVLKTLSSQKTNRATPVVLGHIDVLKYYNSLDLELHLIEDSSHIKHSVVNVLNCVPDEDLDITPGNITQNTGLCSMLAVERGIEWCMQQKADALVTAPISKEAIHKAGYHFPGHTEFLAEKTETSEFMMILASENLRVGLATVHVPLTKVAPLITQKNLIRHLKVLNDSLKQDFGIADPKIAVFGLNPHAGDGGVIGSEEIDIIDPAVKHAQTNGISAQGPFAGDGFFGNSMQKEFDAILAMYHDQGLIPFKALTFGSGVNFTAGLPIIRTSPDHGTAFAIAGQNKADHHSFESAYNLAIKMALNRNKN